MVRAGGLTKLARQTSPSLPNKTNPALEEMSHERDVGPSASGRAHSSPLSTIELQQSKSSTPARRLVGSRISAVSDATPTPMAHAKEPRLTSGTGLPRFSQTDPSTHQ